MLPSVDIERWYFWPIVYCAVSVVCTRIKAQSLALISGALVPPVGALVVKIQQVISSWIESGIDTKPSMSPRGRCQL